MSISLALQQCVFCFRRFRGEQGVRAHLRHCVRYRAVKDAQLMHPTLEERLNTFDVRVQSLTNAYTTLMRTVAFLDDQRQRHGAATHRLSMLVRQRTAPMVDLAQRLAALDARVEKIAAFTLHLHLAEMAFFKQMTEQGVHIPGYNDPIKGDTPP